MVKPEGKNFAVTDAIQKVAESESIEGMPSHRLKQFEIDGEKSIIQNPTEAQRKEHEKCEFELHEVYAIDVVISTGEGKDLLFNKLLKC
ncbi:proliferation-associated protein 2G4-like isoform X1 [Tachypleus tridentatus]|uniref:proliferation-associated protein 2G4-like isoform X1 n=1 Tax=Tachypleus tridentatus TaxID=6853 RepID=UPI003FCF50F2